MRRFNRAFVEGSETGISRWSHDEICWHFVTRVVQSAPSGTNGVLGYFRFVKPIELNFFFSRAELLEAG